MQIDQTCSTHNKLRIWLLKVYFCPKFMPKHPIDEIGSIALQPTALNNEVSRIITRNNGS